MRLPVEGVMLVLAAAGWDRLLPNASGEKDRKGKALT
jgi:hypothetical protein